MGMVVARVRLDPELVGEAYGLGLDVPNLVRRALVEVAGERFVIPSHTPERRTWPPVRVRIDRRVWEALVWRFGSLSAVACYAEVKLDYHIRRMEALMSMTDEEVLELLRRAPMGPKGGVPVSVYLPEPVVEEARRANVAIGLVVKRALLVFAAENLPPVSPLTRPDVEKARVTVRVPRPVAEKLSSVGGPSRAWWFVARALLACARKAREVMARGV